MLDKFNFLKKWSNENSGFITFILWVVTVLTLVFWNQSVWIAFLFILSSIWIWYFLKDHLKEKNKFIIGVITVLSISLLIFLWIQKVFYASPKIFDLTKWFDLKFEEIFNWWNLSKNNTYLWIKKDDQFTNWSWNYLTLGSSSKLTRTYPLYQNLKSFDRDVILLSKFYLSEWAKIWIQFANTKTFDVPTILEDHFNECRIQSIEWKILWDTYNKWFWNCIYKRGCQSNDKFTKSEITPWNYYILAKISWTKLSCYFQKEWDKEYKTIIEDKEMEFQNLWWPVMARMIDGEQFYPRVLSFKLYLRK